MEKYYLDTLTNGWNDICEKIFNLPLHISIINEKVINILTMLEKKEKKNLLYCCWSVIYDTNFNEDETLISIWIIKKKWLRLRVDERQTNLCLYSKNIYF